MQAQNGQIDGLMVLVQNSELSSNVEAKHYIWLDGSYRLNPELALAALLQGITDLFTKMSTTAADQLRLDLK